jgi:hypothetical protein
MRHSRAIRLSPALIVAMVALFVALGGSGLAAKIVAQQKCQTGAIKGVIALNPDAISRGFPDQFSSAAGLFDARFTCGGRTVSARRVDVGIYDVRVLRNPAGYAVGAARAAHAGFSYSKVDATTWRVYMGTLGGAKADIPFVLVLL